MVIGEIIGGAAFHQGEWFIVEVDVFPQNRSGWGALCDQPSLTVIKKHRGHPDGGFVDALLLGIVGILAQGSPGVRDLGQTPPVVVGQRWVSRKGNHQILFPAPLPCLGRSGTGFVALCVGCV